MGDIGWHGRSIPGSAGSADETTPRDGAVMNDAYIERWAVQARRPLRRRNHRVRRAAGTRTDVLVRIERLRAVKPIGATRRPAPPSSCRAEPAGNRWPSTYVWLGVEHILTRHRPSAVRAGADPTGARRAGARSRYHHRLHRRPLASRSAAATLGYFHVPGAAGRGGDRAQHRASVACEIASSRRRQQPDAAAFPGSSPSLSACCTGWALPVR